MNADPFRERPTAADYEADIAMWLRDREPPDMMQMDDDERNVVIRNCRFWTVRDEPPEPPREWPFADPLVIAALIGAAIGGAVIYWIVGTM